MDSAALDRFMPWCGEQHRPDGTGDGVAHRFDREAVLERGPARTRKLGRRREARRRMRTQRLRLHRRAARQAEQQRTKKKRGPRRKLRAAGEEWIRPDG